MDQFQFRIGNKDILVYRSIFAPVKSNMFVLLTWKEAVVIDPNEDSELLALLIKNNIKRVTILLTHEHYDHTSGVNWLKENTGAKIYSSKECAEVISTERGNNPALVALVLADQDRKDGGQRYKEFKTNFRPYTISVDRILEENERMEIGNLRIKVKITPGHCPGAVCYELNNKMIFTGDSLLQNNPVILSFRESRKEIYSEVTLPYLRSLDKNIIVMPGHGDPFILSETKI